MSTALNPNFPVLDYAVCWSAGPAQSPQQSNWCSVLERTQGAFDWNRGKQYELDQVQPGEASITLRNLDGALDPSNTSSPFNGKVIPYRLFRARAQWPATVNLLTQNQASAGDGAAVAAICEQPIAAGMSIPSTANATSTWTLSVASDATAYQGSQVWSTAVPASQNAALPYVVAFGGMSAAPGQAYSAQFEVRCLTATANPTVKALILFFDPSGNSLGYFGTSTPVTLTGSSTASWTQVTVTNAVAPSNASGMQVILWENTVGPTSAHTIEADGNQLEKGTTCSAWTMPGAWYPLFTGYVERWPQSWTSSGNYGTMDLTIVDLFAWYANQQLPAPFLADLLALGPNFLYALNEAQGTTAFADLTNKRGPAIINQAKTVNTLVAGAAVQAADNVPPAPDLGKALTASFLGSPGPVITTAPSSSTLINAAGGGALAIPPNPATGLTGPPASSAWTRIIAARATGPVVASGQITAWSYGSLPPAGGGSGAQIELGGNPNSPMVASVAGPAGGPSVTFPGLGNMTDGSGNLIDKDWHLYGMSISADGKTVRTWCDSSATSNSTTYTSANFPIPAPASNTCADLIGAFLDSNGNAISTWAGALAFACELPFEMTSSTWGNLWQSWRNAWGQISESSDARYQRILNWAGYTGPTRLSAGYCQSYGPATDITGTAVLQALQNVVDTENGQHFIGADGIPTFQSRGDRYSKTPAVTFGENSGEVPYSEAKPDFDPTRVANDIQITQQFGNVLYRATDGPQSTATTSQGKYGTITLSRTVNSMSAAELTSAAQFLLYENKDPLLRFEEIPTTPSATPSLFSTVLGLDLGSCAQINRRPANVPAISATGFVQKISGHIDGSKPSMSVSFQLTNNTRQAVWKIEDPTFGHFDQYPTAY